MKILDFIKRKFGIGYSKDELFEVDYVVWVGDPMDSTYPSYGSMDVPKELIEDLDYEDAEEEIHDYVYDKINYGVGFQLNRLWRNDYINEIFDVPDDIGKLCHLSETYKNKIKNVKRRD